MRDRLRRLFRRPDPPLDCATVGELIHRYLDDQLDPGLADRIEAHLDDCRRCGLEAETYRRIKAALASRRRPVPAESLERLRVFGQELARSGGREPDD